MRMTFENRIMVLHRSHAVLARSWASRELDARRLAQEDLIRNIMIHFIQRV